ncbi:MAG TPA: 50S ribosomal protein L18e [Candidatus Poseidoniales archaeon]|nr:MAG TPA: 50S ribosomal protein L18e [Candidatus Poseidoniales archaeon]
MISVSPPLQPPFPVLRNRATATRRTDRTRRCIDNGMASRRIASKHRGSQMSNPTRKTNARLVDMINQLKAQSRDTGAAVWRDVAMRLSKSRKHWAQPNLSRVSRYAPEGATILVPGKLLGSGELSANHTIAAYSVSNGAREKIEAAGGRVVTYGELMNENPTGTGVVILG